MDRPAHRVVAAVADERVVAAQAFQVGANVGETITLNSITNTQLTALGDVDELNSSIGLVLAETLPEDVRDALVRPLLPQRYVPPRQHSGRASALLAS